VETPFRRLEPLLRGRILEIGRVEDWRLAMGKSFYTGNGDSLFDALGFFTRLGRA